MPHEPADHCTNCTSTNVQRRRVVITTVECDTCGHRENVRSEPVDEEDDDARC